MTATATAQRDDHFALFDSLRAIAALAVFFLHGVYQFAVAREEDHLWYRFAIHLDVAVPIFFAISGFLLYRPFVAARLSGRPIDLRRYGIRRALRILPAYWVALAVITFWFDLDEVKSITGVLIYGGLVQLYDPQTSLRGLGQAWTLNIEATYYIFLPLWIYAIGRFVTRSGRTSLRGEVIAVLALMAFAFAWQIFTLKALTDVANPNSATLIRILPIQFDHLGAGMLLAVLSVWAVDARKRGALRGRGAQLLRLAEERPWLVWGLAAGVWIVTCLLGRSGSRFSPHYSDSAFFLEHVLYTPFVFLLLVPAVFGDRRRDGPRRLLAWRPLVWLGTVSYSFYLWHYAIIAQQYKWLGEVPSGFLGWSAWFMAAVLATVVVSSLSYLVIERPFMRLKIRSRPPRSAPEAAQARAAP